MMPTHPRSDICFAEGFARDRASLVRLQVAIRLRWFAPFRRNEWSADYEE